MGESLPRLIVGLGNPGKEYEYTRHNLGFLVVGRLAKEFDFEFTKNAAVKGFLAKGEVEGNEVYLFLPLTYMNHSGVAVKAVFDKKGLAQENLLVVCDDLNLDFGQLRLRAKGSDGGHNGLDSIVAYLATIEFPRLRLGIGRPAQKEDTVDFVLSGFSKVERSDLNGFIDRAVECCKAWLIEGTAKTMDQFNINKKEK